MLDENQWQQLRESFVAEAEELIQRAEISLSNMERDFRDVDAIHELFRVVHTLKGSAGLIGLQAVVGFTHEYEDLLMRVRDHEIPVTPSLITLCYAGLDRIADLIQSAGMADGDPDPERSRQLLEELAHLRGGVLVAPVSEESDSARQNRERLWHVSARFLPALFSSGFDPASFLRYLKTLGAVEQVETITEGLPDEPGEYDPEACYIGLEINFRGDVAKADIESVFEFIRDLTELNILPPASQLEDYLRLIRSLPEDDKRLGEILVQVGLLTNAELDALLSLQATDPERPLGEVLVEENRVAAEAVQVALDKQQRVREDLSRQMTFLKVSTSKMDDLINQVGELVIAAAGARLLSGQRNDPKLSASVEEIYRHVEAIRETALRLRMVQIGDTFNRFHRVVRETSLALDKSIRLTISGGDTELDKTLVDRIHDPLVHLVRNAIDHGIETAEERRQAGKPEHGTVSLHAHHEAGMIVIEIRDDGHGIDVERVLQKARQSGLVQEGESLDENAALRLIFEPGFSTASAVTNLSGRGVGMDSVRRDIDALRGTIDIDNAPGNGCCFRIRLPLTLAIIEGFLVSVGDQYFVIPLELMTECVERPAVLNERQGDYFIELRGHALPFLDLRRHFGIAGAQARRGSLVVVTQGQTRTGLLVDALHGEVQTVIKPLGALFENLHGISGASILGSGDVALILDINGLVQRAAAFARRSESTTGSPVKGHDLCLHGGL